MTPVGIRTALPFCSCTALGPFRWTSVPSRWAVSCSKKKAEVILLRRKIVEIALQLQLAGRNLFRLMLGLSGQAPRFHHHGAIALFGAEGVLDDFCNSAFPLLHADRSGPVSAGPVRLSGMN